MALAGGKPRAGARKNDAWIPKTLRRGSRARSSARGGLQGVTPRELAGHAPQKRRPHVSDFSSCERGRLVCLANILKHVCGARISQFPNPRRQSSPGQHSSTPHSGMSPADRRCGSLARQRTTRTGDQARRGQAQVERLFRSSVWVPAPGATSSRHLEAMHAPALPPTGRLRGLLVCISCPHSDSSRRPPRGVCDGRGIEPTNPRRGRRPENRKPH